MTHSPALKILPTLNATPKGFWIRY